MRALIDTGAQAWLLADRSFCDRLARAWDLPRTAYEKEALVKGFENKPLQSIGTSIQANLQLQGRTFYGMPLLEADLGDRTNFQVIVGLRFLKNYQLLLDCANMRLHFPKTLPYKADWSTDIIAPLQSLESQVDRQAQWDVERRDQLWREQEAVTVAHVTPRSGSPSVGKQIAQRSGIWFPSTWEADRKASFKKMERALGGTPIQNSTTYKHPPKPTEKRSYNQVLGLDLCLVSHDAFFRNVRRPKSHRHSTLDECAFSVHTLDRAIEDALQQEDEATREEISEKLPAEYAEFVEVFSKTESDTLPPHRECDHRIELLPDATPLRAHPLYSMSSDQLVALKEYLTENLRKEWEVPSGAEYGSPVLFARKPNGGLRLCVDYRSSTLGLAKIVTLFP